MNDSIKVNIEEANAHLGSTDIQFKNIDYSAEWLTSNCVAKAIEKMNTIKDDFDTQIITIKSYLSELDYISTVTPPDVIIEDKNEQEEGNKD